MSIGEIWEPESTDAFPSLLNIDPHFPSAPGGLGVHISWKLFGSWLLFGCESTPGQDYTQLQFQGQQVKHCEGDTGLDLVCVAFCIPPALFQGAFYPHILLSVY